MKKLKYLILHCTATAEGREVSSKNIRDWHTLPPPQGRGWKQVGYSDMIHLTGQIENLVPYDGDGIVQPREITNGAVGTNGETRHIVYVGGITNTGRVKDTRTPEQILAIRNYVTMMITINPDILIGGHNQFAAKGCPSFDVPKWLRSIGVQEKNICKEALKVTIS